MTPRAQSLGVFGTLTSEQVTGPQRFRSADRDESEESCSMGEVPLDATVNDGEFDPGSG